MITTYNNTRAKGTGRAGDIAKHGLILGSYIRDNIYIEIEDQRK